MLISVIIPIYNADKYLQKCLDSISLQSYKEIELILINDGSTDKSFEICKKFEKCNKYVIVINQVNSGPAKARNVGIKAANGTYIGFIDADDEIKADFFETLINVALKTDVDIVCSNIILRSKTNDRTVLINSLPNNKILHADKIKKLILSNYYGGSLGNIPSLCNKLYKSSFLQGSNLMIDESRIRAEDYWFNFYAFKNAKSIVAIDYSGYLYNVSSENSVMKSFREGQFEGFLKTRAELLFNSQLLDIEINYEKWDTEFINNTNEYILMAFKAKKLHLIKDILRNSEFIKAMRNFKPLKIHTKLIKLFVNLKFYAGAYFIYYNWSKKSQF